MGRPQQHTPAPRPPRSHVIGSCLEVGVFLDGPAEELGVIKHAARGLSSVSWPVLSEFPGRCRGVSAMRDWLAV